MKTRTSSRAYENSRSFACVTQSATKAVRPYSRHTKRPLTGRGASHSLSSSSLTHSTSVFVPVAAYKNMPRCCRFRLKKRGDEKMTSVHPFYLCVLLVISRLLLVLLRQLHARKKSVTMERLMTTTRVDHRGADIPVLAEELEIKLLIIAGSSFKFHRY